MPLTEQDYIDIEDQADGLDMTQENEIGAYLEETTDSPGTIAKWIIGKLREWYES